MSVSLRKPSFDCECVRCQAHFSARLPTVFCSDTCRQTFGAVLEKMREKFWLEYLADPDAILPGDMVRLKTAADRDFERSVIADVKAL